MCGGTANLVHHKVEVRTDWSKRLEMSNLESVCRNCHNKIEHYK
ncbi:HNH endonuclease [Gemella sp.]